MSLRTKSAREGYGPAVSLGVTTHVELVLVVVVVVVVVGLVAVSLPHAAAVTAPAAAAMAPIACRRLSVPAVVPGTGGAAASGGAEVILMCLPSP